MMHLFLNGLAASAGAGLTYIRNVVPHLSAYENVQTTIAVPPLLRGELGNPDKISFVEVECRGAAHRFWREQTLLPKLIENSKADVLLSAGNFALRKSPVPQILLSGNSLYTSQDFYRDLRARREYRMWLGTRIRGSFAKRSVHWADCTVAPSKAFAEDLRRWAGGKVTSIYHGFDHDAFFRDQTLLPDAIAQKILPDNDAFRLLFVSHYNYYRNFETLFRALPLLKKMLRSRKIKLFLTCTLDSAANPGSYRTNKAANLIRELDIREEVVELGTIPYHLLHHVYRACDIYATAAYAETFAHPLVEAMASGLPVVASDLPVHREVCGGSALYFKRFVPDDLADRVMEIATSATVAARLSASSEERARDFSWKKHVEQIVLLATDLHRAKMSAKIGEIVKSGG